MPSPHDNPPTPDPPPKVPSPQAQQPQFRDGLEDYHTVADTVGLIPSLRMKDNVFQLLFMVVFTALSILVGFIFWQIGGVIVGLFIGLIGGIILSGIVLMILGWVRAIKRMRR